MTVQTSQVDLSQGMGMAAMQVNFVTRRAGSNDYHGRVFEDFRNTDLNANSWFNNAIGQPRNPIILNDFGGSARRTYYQGQALFLWFVRDVQAAWRLHSHQPTEFQISSPLAQQGIFTYTQTGPNGKKPGTATVNLFYASCAARRSSRAAVRQIHAGLPF